MEKIFDQVAKNNNTTKEQVKKDIEKAIEIAIKNSKGNSEAEDFWNEVIKNKNFLAESTIKEIIQKIIT